ncbi:hypothetical protein AArcCO_0584 [Halalkaliarchaeum sp. AArc-CO]|uniref:GDSL-type esterase/lipase family protein n=1 Tax=Halalkaliarchaeum sp. AArc-CO TaxID=2866381 RepID=UPI00217D1BDD|nr:GDSL-type esterase/lipase family protein [Halalkaliarchaeum sp. AArc-CO]UWG49908.1 hypothetical protein AArcCO_0584 [Halalkaliarchaeum sp. AArc-CO]
MSPRRRDRDRDERKHRERPRKRTRVDARRGGKQHRRDRRSNDSRERTRVNARRGREAVDTWGNDRADSDRSKISIRPYSRFPTLDDYDRTAHAWRESYVQATSGYRIGVSACGGLTSPISGEDAEKIIDEFERERRRNPRPGDGSSMPGREPPTKNVGGRLEVPDDFVAWHWTLEDVDGKVVSRTRRRANLGPDACGATLTAPDLGRYTARLRLELADGEETAATSFELRNDRLIVSVGDSYASGEGNPDEPRRSAPDGGSTGPVWLEPEAHRSLQGGPALAAAEFESRFDGNLATFLTVASTGATIDEGLLGPQNAWQNGGQLDEIERTVGNRTIDALVISIGGNDVGFADGLKDLLYRVHRTRSATVRETEEAIDRLLERHTDANGRTQRAKYDRLAERIDALEPEVREVFVTGYPTGLFDRANGSVGGGCGTFNPLPLDAIVPGPIGEFVSEVLPSISKRDARAIKRLGTRLNEAVEEAARRHGWTYVDGIADGFEGRGYCRSKKHRYFVTASETWNDQRNFKGMMHPNRKGHRVYRDRIADELRRKIGDRHDADARQRDHRDDATGGGDGGGSDRSRKRRSSDRRRRRTGRSGSRKRENTGGRSGGNTGGRSGGNTGGGRNPPRRRK